MNRFNNNFNPSCQTSHTLEFHFLFHYLLPRVLLVNNYSYASSSLVKALHIIIQF